MSLVDIVKRFVPIVEIEKAGRSTQAEYDDMSPIVATWGKEQPRGRGTSEDYLNTYGSSVWVYVCVTKIFSSIGQVPMKVWKRDMKNAIEKESWTEVVDPENKLVKIINTPNPYISFQDWLEFTTASKELTGNAYTEIIYDSDGVPIEMYPMLAHRLKPVPHPKDFISGFIYSINKEEIKFTPEEVLWFKTTNPKDQYYGMAPMRPAELSIIVDMYASIYNKAFFKNSAIPAGVLETDLELNTPVIKRLKREWSKFYQGPSKAFFLAVLEQGMKYHTIAPNARDMQFAQLRDRNRDEILACYGVPGTIAGVKGANYSLAESEWQQYWAETITPKLNSMELQLNRFFVPKFKDPSLYLEFDTEKIMATRANKESETRIAASLIDRGMITINEWRKKQGLKDVPWGEEWMMPMNLQPADQLTGNTQLGGHQGLSLGGGQKIPKPGMVTPPSQDGIGKTYLPYSVLVKLLEAKNSGGAQPKLIEGSVLEGDTELSPFQVAKLKHLLTILRRNG